MINFLLIDFFFGIKVRSCLVTSLLSISNLHIYHIRIQHYIFITSILAQTYNLWPKPTKAFGILFTYYFHLDFASLLAILGYTTYFLYVSLLTNLTPKLVYQDSAPFELPYLVCLLLLSRRVPLSYISSQRFCYRYCFPFWWGIIPNQYLQYVS